MNLSALNYRQNSRLSYYSEMRFLSDSGVSMVQGLVVSAVLASSALIATRLIQDQKKLVKATESRDQIEQLHNVIYSTLQNREHCKATIASMGLTYAGATLGAATITVNSLYTKTTSGGSVATFNVHDGSTWSETNTYMNGAVTIPSMRFRFPQAGDPAGTNTISYPAKLIIEYARLEGKGAQGAILRTGDGYGAKRIKKEIPIILQRTPPSASLPAGDLNCYAVQLGSSINGMTMEGNNNLNQEFCSNLGTNGSMYVWDSNTNRCVMKNNVCPDKYVFAGVSSTGNAVCNPLESYLQYMVDTTTQYNCPDSTYRINLTTDGAGRIVVNCTLGLNCPAQTLYWGASCNGGLGSQAHGTSAFATDATAPGVGTARYECHNGSWVLDTFNVNCI